MHMRKRAGVPQASRAADGSLKASGRCNGPRYACVLESALEVIVDGF